MFDVFDIRNFLTPIVLFDKAGTQIDITGEDIIRIYALPIESIGHAYSHPARIRLIRSISNGEITAVEAAAIAFIAEMRQIEAEITFLIGNIRHAQPSSIGSFEIGDSGERIDAIFNPEPTPTIREWKGHSFRWHMHGYREETYGARDIDLGRSIQSVAT